MILEFIEYLLTPCSPVARSLGFLKSSIQVRARYKRCRAAWEPHLLHTRTALLEAAARAKNHRRALILGAGLLHDIPLEELAEKFAEVILVDIVHTLPCRLQVARFRNARLCAMDLTGVAAALLRTRSHPQEPLPVSCPEAFLEEANIDFVASVNLLSQLGWVPGKVLGGKRSEEELGALRRHLVEAHLEYLGKFEQLNAHTVLITDVSWRTVRGQESGAGEGMEEWDVLQGVVLPAPERAWDWHIAPAPELARDADHIARVHAYLSWGRAAGKGIEGGQL